MHVHCMSAVIPRDPSPYTEIDWVPLAVLMPWKVSGRTRKVSCFLWIFEKLECWSVFDVYWNNISNGYVNMWGNECLRILTIDIFVLCNWPRCRSYGFFVTICTVVCILAKGLFVVSHALLCGLEVSWNMIYLVISVNWKWVCMYRSVAVYSTTYCIVFCATIQEAILYSRMFVSLSFQISF